MVAQTGWPGGHSVVLPPQDRSPKANDVLEFVMCDVVRLPPKPPKPSKTVKTVKTGTQLSTVTQMHT
eukprot:1207119-Lingulodinium_polyedra.AAC.1